MLLESYTYYTLPLFEDFEDDESGDFLLLFEDEEHDVGCVLAYPGLPQKVTPMVTFVEVLVRVYSLVNLKESLVVSKGNVRSISRCTYCSSQ